LLAKKASNLRGLAKPRFCQAEDARGRTLPCINLKLNKIYKGGDKPRPYEESVLVRAGFVPALIIFIATYSNLVVAYSAAAAGAA
jgi:hypothetical protein